MKEEGGRSQKSKFTVLRVNGIPEHTVFGTGNRIANAKKLILPLEKCFKTLTDIISGTELFTIIQSRSNNDAKLCYSFVLDFWRGRGEQNGPGRKLSMIFRVFFPEICSLTPSYD